MITKRDQLDLDYAKMMGKPELLKLMRYHAAVIKQHTDDKADVLHYLVILKKWG